jgi:hypothetical protein
MKKRKDIELFSISLLDMLFGALGAMIFLFIIVPKGGIPPDDSYTVAMSLDRSSQKLFGDFKDTDYQIGDSLKIVIAGYGNFPIPAVRGEKCPPCPECPPPPPPPTPCPPCPDKKPCPPCPEAVTGLPPGAGNFIFYVSWDDQLDNIDLFVCRSTARGERCVHGGNRNEREIGTWDSGKSRTGFFGRTDFRTSMEAVRQFDPITPGEYKVYGLYKDNGGTGKNEVSITMGVISQPAGRNLNMDSKDFILPLDNSRRSTRVYLATVNVFADGAYQIFY